MKLLWKKLLLGKFLLLKIVKYWNNKLAIWSHWSLHCYKQHLDQSAGNFESRKVFYGCAVVDVVVIKFCASKSISNSGMQFYFILHLFLSEFSFTLFICVCVPPCDCLVALYLLLFRAIIHCLLLFLRITVLLLFTCLFRALILCLLFVSFLL